MTAGVAFCRAGYPEIPDLPNGARGSCPPYRHTSTPVCRQKANTVRTFHWSVRSVVGSSPVSCRPIWI